MGDVQADYDSSRDPRVLMGNYQEYISNATYDEDVVDTTVPIYEHINFANETGTGEDVYLFKVKEVGDDGGWVLSPTLPLESTDLISVYLTCFQSSLFDCVYNKWYWGYDKYEYPIHTLKVNGGQCALELCLQNLTLQLSTDNYTYLHGEFNRSLDINGTGRYTWTNQRDTDYFWFYRALEYTNDETGEVTWTYNWVYSYKGADRVACAPGYVEAPLYCTTFVYAGSTENGSLNNALSTNHLGVVNTDDDTDTIWKLGGCDPTSSPTMEPTTEPSIHPTVEPINGSNVSCSYNGDSYGLNDTVTAECEFGFNGAGDTAQCQSDGTFSDWTQGCFRISFADHFKEFDDTLWSVEETVGVSGDAVLATDGTEAFRFIPDDPSLVSRIKSKERIVWPMRARAVVEKRLNECNLWSIALGPAWATRSDYSARVMWQCLGGSTYNPQTGYYEQHKQWSLYTPTFRLYDADCWNANETDTMEVVFSIRDAGSDNVAKLTSPQSDCASLREDIPDLLSQSPWEDAYLWFGSYPTSESEDSDVLDAISDPIIGRFYSMLYTQFWTDFDTLMPQIWDHNLSTMNATAEETTKAKLYVAPGQHLVADAELFQFEIPFALKLGIRRPDPSYGDGTWSSGKYAHFVTVGRSDYVLDADEIGSDEDVLQVVWDGTEGVRLVYTTSGLWETGLDEGSSYCNWNLQGYTYEVTIYVDTEKVTIVDEVCNRNNMTVVHGMNTTARFTNLSIGFIDPRNKDYGDSDRIAFTGVEAYQYSTSEYAGALADADEEQATYVDSLIDVYPDPTSSPTNAPTNEPTSPTNEPSMEPTRFPTYQDKGDSLAAWIYVVIVIASLCRL